LPRTALLREAALEGVCCISDEDDGDEEVLAHQPDKVIIGWQLSIASRDKIHSAKGAQLQLLPDSALES
jgi:hypothetical protein